MLIMNENEETKAYDLRGMYLPELEEFVISQGWQKFRAKQIFEWIHKKHVRTAEEMKNLPMCERNWKSTLSVQRRNFVLLQKSTGQLSSFSDCMTAR